MINGLASLDVGLHDDRNLRLDASVVTIGAFDGVHRGHQALIGKAVEEARERGIPSVVYTFDAPPKVFFGLARALIPLAEKLRRIASLGPTHIVVACFDRDYAARPASAFIDELAALAPRRIFVGGDFRFGSCQSGNVALLRRFFDTRTIAPVRCEAGEPVSSSRIRALRETGRAKAAAALEGWMGLTRISPLAAPHGGFHE